MSKLSPAIIALTKSRRVPATVIETFDNYATVTVKGSSKLNSIRVVGGPVTAGDNVYLEWNGFEPVINAAGGSSEGASQVIVSGNRSNIPQTGAWEIGGWEVSQSGIISHDSGNYRIDPTKPSLEMGTATDIDTGIGVFLGKSVYANNKYSALIGDPGGQHLIFNGNTCALTITGTITGLIIGTDNPSFTINQDRDDTTVSLIFGRTTGGDATISWDGTSLRTDQPVGIGGAGVADRTLFVRRINSTLAGNNFNLYSTGYNRLSGSSMYVTANYAQADTAITSGSLYANYNSLATSSSAILGTTMAGMFWVRATQTSAINYAYGVYSRINTIDTATINYSYGVYIDWDTVAGQQTYGVGLYIDSVVGATGYNRAIQTNAGSIILNSGNDASTLFQFGGQSGSYLLYAHAGYNSVGINVANYTYAFDVDGYGTVGSAGIRLQAHHIGMGHGAPNATDMVYLGQTLPATPPAVGETTFRSYQTLPFTSDATAGFANGSFMQYVVGSPGLTHYGFWGTTSSITLGVASTLTNAQALNAGIWITDGVSGTITNAYATQSTIDVNDGSIVVGTNFLAMTYFEDGSLTHGRGFYARPYGTGGVGDTGNIAIYSYYYVEGPTRYADSETTITSIYGLNMGVLHHAMVTTNVFAIKTEDGHVVFNESGHDDSDFRVETNNYTHAIFVDSSADTVGFFKSSPIYPVDVYGNIRAMAPNAQLLLTWDGTFHSSFTSGATGALEISTGSNIILDPAGSASGAVLPGGLWEDDIGSYALKWRTLYASELYVENLVAQYVMATIGGRIMVAPTTKLIADVGSGDSTIDVEHQNLHASGPTGKYIYFMSAPSGVPQIEAMKTADADPTPITGGYRYSVTRNLDGSGANDWKTGDAVVSLGYNVGEGYIDITSTSTMHSHLGPTMTMYVRDASTNWDDIVPRVSLGNLDSFLGLGAEFGLAIGNDLTISNPADQTFQGIIIGDTYGVAAFNLDISIINNVSGYTVIGLDHDDGLYVTDGNTLGKDYTVFVASITDDFFGGSSGLDKGDVIIGKPFHSAGGNDKRGVWWDDSATSLYIYSSASEYFKFSQALFQMYAGSTEVFTVDYAGSVPHVYVGQSSYSHVLISNQALYVKYDAQVWTEITNGNIYLGDRAAATGVFSQLNATQFQIIERVSSVNKQRMLIQAGSITLKDSNEVQRILIDNTAITVGRGSGFARAYITDSGFYYYNPSNIVMFEATGTDVIIGNNEGTSGAYVHLTSSVLTFNKYISSAWRAMIQLDASGNAIFGRTDGSYSNMIWNNSTGRLEFRSGTGAMSVYIEASSGFIYAGNGKARISDGGFDIISGSAWDDGSSYRILYGGSIIGHFGGYQAATLSYSHVRGEAVAGKGTVVLVSAMTAGSQTATIEITAYGNNGSQWTQLKFHSNGTSSYNYAQLVPGGFIVGGLTFSTSYPYCTTAGYAAIAEDLNIGSGLVVGSLTSVNPGAGEVKLTASLYIGSSFGVRLYEGSSNVLYLATGDSLYLVSGNLTLASGLISCSGDIYTTAWTSWSPTLGGMTVRGSGSYYRYKRVGKLCFIWFNVDATGATGADYITLPVAGVSGVSQTGTFISAEFGAGACLIDMAVSYSRLYFYTDTWGSTPTGGDLNYDGQFVYETA